MSLFKNRSSAVVSPTKLSKLTQIHLCCRKKSTQMKWFWMRLYSSHRSEHHRHDCFNHLGISFLHFHRTQTVTGQTRITKHVDYFHFMDANPSHKRASRKPPVCMQRTLKWAGLGLQVPPWVLTHTLQIASTTNFNMAMSVHDSAFNTWKTNSDRALRAPYRGWRLETRLNRKPNSLVKHVICPSSSLPVSLWVKYLKQKLNEVVSLHQAQSKPSVCSITATVIRRPVFFWAFGSWTVLQIRVHHLSHSEKKLAKVAPEDNLVLVRYKKQIETQFQGFVEM